MLFVQEGVYFEGDRIIELSHLHCVRRIITCNIHRMYITMSIVLFLITIICQFGGGNLEERRSKTE